MKILSSTLIASLLLNGIALPVGAWAEDAAQVCATDTFSPNAKTEAEIGQKCKGPRSVDCVNTRKAIAKWSEDYKKLAEKACKKSRDSLNEISQLNQSSSFGEVKSKADAGIADIETLLAANKTILDAMPGITEKNLDALREISQSPQATPVFKRRVGEISSEFKRLRERPEVMKKEILKPNDNSGISGTAQEGSKAQIEALAQSQAFVRTLLMDKEKNEAARQKLTEAKNNAEKSQKNTQTTDGGTKSSDSGFNPMSLLPLAAPLAGLLMQQKQQSSGLSDPTTPTNPYANTPPAALAGTSLDPKSSGQSVGAKLENPKKPDAEMHMPDETYAAVGASVEPFGGDITNGNGESKAPALGGVGSYSANSGGGASDSSGSSTNPGKGERKPASGAHSAGDEGMIGAGGGGGGYSAPTDTAAEADGGMKDMLQDMESTLEDAPTGLFAEMDQQNSNGGVAPENSESLFPRVRACYVRNLKKGFVLNGLGEKLPESESH